MSSLQSVSPPNGSVFTSSVVNISANAYRDDQDQDYYHQLLISTNSSPTYANAAYNSGWTRSTSPDLETNSYTETYYWSTTLAPGVYYARVDLEESSTFPAPGSPIIQSFTVVLNPTATPVSPAAGAWFAWSGTDPYPFSATWTSNSSGGQSAYQLVVERVSDGLVVVDSGKVLSSATTASVNVGLTYKDTLLRWKVRVWDTYDSISPYTATRTMTLATPPTASILAPTQNQVLTTGTPSVSFTVGVSGARTINRVVASIWQGVTKVWEKSVTGTWANGQTILVTDSNTFLTNNTPYSYRVQVFDTQSLASLVATRDFSVSYTPPNAPGSLTVGFGNYDSLGYLSVSWSGASPDADFYSWEIEREDSLLDVNTGSVLSVGGWVNIGSLYVNTPAGNVFYDYTAPSGYRVRYRVRQVAFKFNTEVVSTYTTSTTVDPVTGSYWLIAGTNGATATVFTFQFSIVTGDQFTHEKESQTFVLMGRGRYNERGTDLGIKGTLQCQLRNTGGTTSRQKKLALEAYRDAHLSASMRTPFGDQYRVVLGDISITRVAGVGREEFCDVAIPYEEVVNQ